MYPRIPIPNRPQITVKKRIIPHIKPDNGGIQPNIRLGDMVSEQKIRPLALISLGEMLLNPIQRLKDAVDVLVVCLLRGGEACLVDAVVQHVVDPFVHGVDSGAVLRGVERLGGLAQGGLDQAVEGCVQHADYLRGLVVHDRLALLVPERGHRETPRIVWVGFEVELRVLCEAVERVDGVGAFAAVVDPVERVKGGVKEREKGGG